MRVRPLVRALARRRAALARILADRRLDIMAWLQEVERRASKMRPETPLYRSFDAYARRLTVVAIRASKDPAAVSALEVRLRGARLPGPALYDLDRVWSRTELGLLIAEATNRARQLAAGDLQREKGPALDPARIPDDRLDWLIQRHRDMAVVEACRAERERRSHLARAA